MFVPGVFGVHAEDVALLVGDVSEDLVHTLRCQRNLFLLCVLVHLFIYYLQRSYLHRIGVRPADSARPDTQQTPIFGF